MAYLKELKVKFDLNRPVEYTVGKLDRAVILF